MQVAFSSVEQELELQEQQGILFCTRVAVQAHPIKIERYISLCSLAWAVFQVRSDAPPTVLRPTKEGLLATALINKRRVFLSSWLLRA